MDVIKLADNYSLALEQAENKMRLVVYCSGVENVCRKETTKNLEKFSQLNEAHLFKGRLQLQKNAAGINVIVKGRPVGKIDEKAFAQLLNGSTLAVSK
jgi:hypothetical protein